MSSGGKEKALAGLGAWLDAGGTGNATRSTRSLASFPATFVERSRTRVLELRVYRADTMPFSARQALYSVFQRGK